MVAVSAPSWQPDFGHCPGAGRLAHQPCEIPSRRVGQHLDRGDGMLPRQVLPRQFYLITRRCTQRQFLLRPDKATNNGFLYCLIDAALRCEIGERPVRGCSDRPCVAQAGGGSPVLSDDLGRR